MRRGRSLSIDHADELEALRQALVQVTAEKEAKQLELAQLSAEALRLRQRILDLQQEDAGSESDQESMLAHSAFGSLTHNALGSALNVSNMQVLTSISPPPPPSPPSTEMASKLWSPMMLHPEWQVGSYRSLRPPPYSTTNIQHVTSENLEPYLGSLQMSNDPPPCYYSCFRAGPPVALSVMNDIATLGLHWLRSFEVTGLSSETLASFSERGRLSEEYSQTTLTVRPVVNFIVWRRSLILPLSLACLGAFGFGLFGDNMSTLRHMRDMHEVSNFHVSYEVWKEKTMRDLPRINCEDIDGHFAQRLERRKDTHDMVADTCSGLLQAHITCEDPVSKAVSGCWEPGFCSAKIADNCPLACTGEHTCADTRDAGAFTYEKFTAAFGKAMVYMLMEQLSKAEFQKLLFIVFTKLVTAVLLILASVNWANWSLSHRFLLWAWMVTFCAPFLRSVVPTPILIDWEPIDHQLEAFLIATNQHYNVSSRLDSLAHVAGISCKDHKLEQNVDGSWEMAHDNTVWFCGKVASASWWFPWSSVLRKGKDECSVVTREIGFGDDATKLVDKDKEKLCGLINSTTVEDVKDDPLSSLREIFDVPWVRNSAFGFIGMISSILSFRALMPLALSIAPGLLTAAIRIKVMMPESYLPGVFIAIMPLLYVPLIWSFSMFIVQGVGDPYLLAGIACLAFSPLVYTVVAVWMRVTSPMSRRGAQVFSDTVWYLANLLRVIGVCFIAYYMTRVGMRFHEIETSRKGLAAFLIEQGKELLLPLLIGQVDNLISLVFSGPLWSLLFSFIVQLYLTAVVASDWMLRASAEEWDSHGEECLVELHENGHLGDKRELAMLHRKREAAMAAMLELTARRPTGILGH
jgi:hypothetical protein